MAFLMLAAFASNSAKQSFKGIVVVCVNSKSTIDMALSMSHS
jgi:hypothetical protein